MKLLTTITPYWGRPEALGVWLEALKGCSIPEVEHLLYCVGDSPSIQTDLPIRLIHTLERPGASIGHYHNLGAQAAETEWIMKLDVDCIPNVRFFKELIPVLQSARPRQWFNAGMFYINQRQTELALGKTSMPLTEDVFNHFIKHRPWWCEGTYILPAATNFICRREDYLHLGGCSDRFRGYGWEDYHQIFMLERYERDENPLPGALTLANVTKRCRDEISRPKAFELWQRNPWLALLHRWHPKPRGGYRAPQEDNRRLLFELLRRSSPSLCPLP